MAQTEDLDEAEALLPTSESPLDAWDMACVLDAVAETADHDMALALADRAPAAALTTTSCCGP